MKRIALISFAAIAALVSCQKEDFTNEAQTGNSPVFTASIATGETKTTLSDDSPAKILWESTDRITITDGTHTAVYKLSAGEGTKSGTFIKDSGDDLDNPGTYTATYGAAPSNYQVYSSAGSVPLYMTAPETSSTDGLVFTAQCGVLRVKLTDASHDIMRVEVSDASGNTYRVTSSEAVDIASATTFYIALPAGTYTSLNIYDDNFQMASKTGISLAVTAGHVKPAVSASLTFADCTTKGFKEINSVVRSIVQLWADGPFWSETNIGAETPEAYGQYFAWGYTTAYSWTGSAWSPSITFDATGFSNYTTHTYSDMATAAWGAGWSVPTADQLKTLINASDSDPKGKCSVTEVTEGVAGIRITGTTEGYTSNSIFLPAAGDGNGSVLEYPGQGGFYWSSEQANTSCGSYLCLAPGQGYFVDRNKKCYGYSVRPVYAPAEPVLLSGEFSVSETKKVKFTKGNLYWNGTDWKIESNQTDYPTEWNTNHVGHFYWSKTATVAYAKDYSDGGASTEDAFFCGEANPMTVDGQSGLYALSSEEWSYLIEARDNADNLYKCGVTVSNGGTSYTSCLIIAPDDYKGTALSAITDWSLSNINTLGLVCLPAVGYRNGSSLNDGGSYGDYWSATPKGYEEEYAFVLYFEGSSINPSTDYYRSNGLPVRLVYSEAPAPTTGTAKATISGQEVDVAWVQLWKDGPKFAVKNVGANANTDKGSTMTYTEAAKTGNNYVWGSNWKTPSKDEMDYLRDGTKVSCSYCQDSGVWGFKFTGVEENYTGNSLFFPSNGGNSGAGEVNYWSSTAGGNVAYYLYMSVTPTPSVEIFWLSHIQSSTYYVRPVLSN